MPRYNPLDSNWKSIIRKNQRDNDWKIGMLVYLGVRSGTLIDLHIIATKPSRQGSYSDAHVTFALTSNEKHHVYYQVNDGKLVADYVLAPHGWRASYWVQYPDLKATTEAEIGHFVDYWRSAGRLDNPPRATD